MAGYCQPDCMELALNTRQAGGDQGAPTVKGKVVYVSEDKKVSHGVWESTPGVFKMTFANDDSGYVLSGEAVAHFEDGTSWKLSPGTAYTFKAGTTVQLEILKTWRKIFFNYHPQGTQLSVGY